MSQNPIIVVAAGFTKNATITPSDSTVIPAWVKAIYVGGAGDVSVLMPGQTVPFVYTAVPAGTILPIAPRRVMAASTATAISAMG